MKRVDPWDSVRGVVIQIRKNGEAVYFHTNMSAHYGA